MSLRVVTMAELRLEVLLEPERTGQAVAEVCPATTSPICGRWRGEDRSGSDVLAPRRRPPPILGLRHRLLEHRTAYSKSMDWSTQTLLG